MACPDTLKRRRAGTALSAAGLCILLAAAPAWAQSAIQNGGSYAEGTDVVSAAAGIGFAVPGGFRADMDEASGLLALTSPEIRAAVWGFSAGTPEDLADLMLADLEELGLSLTPDQIDQTDPDRISGSFDVLSDAGMGRLIGSVVRGPHGNTVGAAALGAAGSDAELRQVVEGLLRAVRWDVPQAQSWQAQIAGAELVKTGAYSDYSADPYGGNNLSAAGRDDVRIVLCSDRSYEFVSDGTFIVSTPDVSVTSDGSDQHQGMWSLVGDLSGTAWLVLEPWDRDEVVYEVEEVDGDIALDRGLYAVGSAGC